MDSLNFSWARHASLCVEPFERDDAAGEIQSGHKKFNLVLFLSNLERMYSMNELVLAKCLNWSVCSSGGQKL